MENKKLSAGAGEPTEPIIQKETVIHNVGEEFMKWAEENWALETLMIAGLRINENDNCEACPYYVIRDIFVSKINELSKMTEEEIKKEFQLLIGHKGTEKENDGFVSNAIEIKKK